VRPSCLCRVWGNWGKERNGHRKANRQNLPRLWPFSYLGRAACRFTFLAEAEDNPQPALASPCGAFRCGATLVCPFGRPALLLRGKDEGGRIKDEPDGLEFILPPSSFPWSGRAPPSPYPREDRGHPATVPTPLGRCRASPRTPETRQDGREYSPAAPPHRPAGEGTQQYTKWSACHEKSLYHRASREDL
jgi:hypothetical protein